MSNCRSARGCDHHFIFACAARLPSQTAKKGAQFSVLRNAATEPPGYSENKEGELEYKLKTELKTKYPAEGAYR